MPARIQLRRTKGWGMPPSTVKADRSSRWGNPYQVGMSGIPDAATPLALFKTALAEQTLDSAFEKSILRKELRGKSRLLVPPRRPLPRRRLAPAGQSIARLRPCTAAPVTARPPVQPRLWVHVTRRLGILSPPHCRAPIAIQIDMVIIIFGERDEAERRAAGPALFAFRVRDVLEHRDV